MTPALTALLCLGEIRGGEGTPWSGRDPPHSQALVCRRPRAQEAHGRRGPAQDSGPTSHRDSLPGLSVGPRSRAQAGESVPRGHSPTSSRGTGVTHQAAGDGER